MISLLLLFFSSAAAISSSHRATSTVKLSYGTFQGTSTSGIDSFLGMPFAQAERFDLPRPPAKLSGVQNASTFGAACLQQPGPLPNITGLPPLPANAVAASTVSENCLFVNIIRPSYLPPGYKLPVLFWIFGSGFEFGDSSQYNGSTVVACSIALGEPFIYVSINYRQSECNVILNPLQGEALCSKAFPTPAFFTSFDARNPKAMSFLLRNLYQPCQMLYVLNRWGQSAGAISVGLHMVLNHGDTEGLFRGAVMESGSPAPLPDITTGQHFYDRLVADTNYTCSRDTFPCLKTVPFEILQSAVNKSLNTQSFSSLHLAWQPLVDGEFIAENAQDSIAKGAYAKIPFITGDCDDEGMLFSLSTLNLTTDQEVVNYLHHNYYPLASDEGFQSVADLYPSDPTQGSPFDMGMANQLSPQFKRIIPRGWDFPSTPMILLGSSFQDPRHLGFLKGIPLLGSAHTSDIPEFYGAGTAPDFQGTDVLINFANNLDPNHGSSNKARNLSTLIHWPKYNTNTTVPPLLTFLDPNVLTVTPDMYRATAMAALTRLSRKFP